MNLEDLYREIDVFNEETHGSSDYDSDQFFVKGSGKESYAPLSYLVKKENALSEQNSLLSEGFVCDSYELVGGSDFGVWFAKQFSRKLIHSVSKNISILQRPEVNQIFDAIAAVNKNYEILRTEQILLNGKNLPIQLGEWFAKSIFGLRQAKSSSQRGFDFYLGENRIEVKTHWSDQSSPKGVKVRKTLVELSDNVIIMYIARNFLIREICFLDSNFVVRKFSGKGHTIFF